MIRYSDYIGDIGEEKALEFLIKKGYEFVDKNYHSRYGVIDIIVKDKDYIVFVEVKTRKKGSLARPSEFVDTCKQKRILKTAKIYLSGNLTDLQPRFDVIEVTYKGNEFEIEHIENAFGE